MEGEDFFGAFLVHVDRNYLLDRFCVLENAKKGAFNPYLRALQSFHDYMRCRNMEGWNHPLMADNVDIETLWEHINISTRPFVRKIDKKVSKWRKIQNDVQQTSVVLPENVIEQLASKTYFSDGRSHEDSDEGSVDRHSDGDLGGELDSEQGSAKSEDDQISDEKEDAMDFEPHSDNRIVEESEDDDMEAWLDEVEQLEEIEEQRLNRLKDKHSIADESDGEDNILATVQQELYNDDSAGDEKNRREVEAPYRYEDYFVGGVKGIKNQHSHAQKGIVDEENDSAQMIEDDSSEGTSHLPPPSTGQQVIHKDRPSASLLREIEEREAALLHERPWQLRGEVKAVARPVDSLLELAADVERCEVCPHSLILC